MLNLKIWKTMIYLLTEAVTFVNNVLKILQNL